MTSDRAAVAFRYRDPGSQKSLDEFPVGTLRGLNVPFIHSYQLLVGRLLSSLLQKVFGLSPLFVHDMHMVDLYRALDSLDNGAISGVAAGAYRLSWLGQGANSLGILGDFIDRCTDSGWRWASIDELFTEGRQVHG